MTDIKVVIVITGVFIVASIGAAIGAYLERDNRASMQWGECRYYIKGDGCEKIALPYGWTLTDVLFLRALLNDHYMVGCKILYGSEETGVSEL